jgi:hypothetical protein
MDTQQQQAIIARFDNDEALRKSVLEDAGLAVKKEFGIDLPFPMRVLAEGAGYRIEPVSGTADGLSDGQLALASGGKGGGGSPAAPAWLRSGGSIIIEHGGVIVSTNGGNFRR